MAQNAFLKLVGDRQGEITGSSSHPGKEGSIIVNAVNHKLVVGGDTSNRQPDNLKHAPILITKNIDNSSPKLMKAFIDNERFPEFRLDFYQADRTMQNFQFYTIELFDAIIVSIRFAMLNNTNPDNVKYPEREYVRFKYKEIKWTFQDPHFSVEGTWESSLR